MSIMNSEEYWNSRFSKNDWEKNDGRGQTEYFARMLCENLPEWLSQEIIDNNYSICDLGCAEGDSLPVLRSTFEKNPLYGEDFQKLLSKLLLAPILNIFFLKRTFSNQKESQNIL